MNANELNYKKPQLNEGTIDRLRYIVDNRSATRVQFDNGDSMEVDLFTASAIIALYNAVNDQNKAKIEEKIGESKEMFYKIADFAFSKVNSVKENAQLGRGDVLINDETETVKMTESAYSVKPKSSKITIKEQPYILINKPGIGETAYSVNFTKKNPILEQTGFEVGTRVHAGIGKKGVSGIVIKEGKGYVFFRSDEGKNYKAIKEKVMPVSDFTFVESKKSRISEKSVSKDQQRAAGAALAAKKGETPVSELQGASKEMYDSMTKKELEDFAGTKHAGLPEKVNEAKDYKAEKDKDGTYTIYTVGETGNRQDLVKDGLSKSQAKKMIDKLYSKDLGLIDEDSIDENAFNQAAADAALAGKTEFEFHGKTYPVKMDKDTALKISENYTNPIKRDADGRPFTDLNQWIANYKKREEDNMHSENVVELAKLVGDSEHIILADKLLGRREARGYLDARDSKTQQKLHEILWNRLLSQHGEDVYSRVDEELEAQSEEGWTEKAYLDPDDYGPDAGNEMAETQLHFIVYAITEIKECMRGGVHMPDWLQNKISAAHHDLQGIHSYMEGSRRKRQMCGPISEGYVGSDYGPNAASGMARTQLSFMKYAAEEVLECISSGTPVPEWYQNKISKVHRAIEAIHAYMEGKRHDTEEETGMTVDIMTPASQPSADVDAMFVGGDDIVAESKPRRTRKSRVKENAEEMNSNNNSNRQLESFKSEFTDSVILPLNTAMTSFRRLKQKLLPDSMGKFKDLAFLDEEQGQMLDESIMEMGNLHEKLSEIFLHFPNVDNRDKE